MLTPTLLERFNYKLLSLCLILLISACGSDNNIPETVDTENGRIALTFDDVYIENWNNLKNILELRGATATFFVSRYGDDSAPLNTKTEQLTQILYDLEERGFEIASHTFGHKRVPDFIDEFGLDQWVKEEVKASLCLMIEDGFSVYSFAYPFSNANTPETDNEVLKIFNQVRLYNGRESSHAAGIIRGSEQVIMSAGIDEEFLDTPNLKSVIDEITENGSTLVLTAHDIAESNSEQLFITPSSLIEIIDYASSKGVEFINFKNVISDSPSSVDHALCE